jgi:hypothetical protein
MNSHNGSSQRSAEALLMPPLMLVRVKVVNGRMDRIKTQTSKDEIPLDPDFATVLLKWKSVSRKTAGDCVFPNPITDRCYRASPIQQDYIRPAGCCLVRARSVLQPWASGAGKSRADVWRFTKNVGSQPGSLTQWDGMPSVMPIVHGWTTPVRQWRCSRS